MRDVQCSVGVFFLGRFLASVPLMGVSGGFRGVWGFVVLDAAPPAGSRIGDGGVGVAGAGWLREGRLRYREDVVDGLENAPAAFIGMLGGDNIGKRLVKVA